MNRRIAILDAPSNLGLRPPTTTSVPGCAKAPGALRDHGLVERLGARDAGCLTPPRYDPADWRPGDGVCHAPAIARYSTALAERIGAIIDADEFPVVLGGDCSILLGSALAMHRLGEAVGGRIGLVFVDGHSDFRHPGNASYVGAAAGEDLALVTGRGQADLAAIEGRRPYFRDIDVVVLGIRTQDEYRLDLQAAGIVTRPVPLLRTEGAARTAQWAHDQLADCAGYWVHVDVDVLDPAVMPAVDAPDPGGIAFAELELLIAGLVDTPHCLGIEITVFDPDYDPDGSYAAEIVSTLVAGLSAVRRPEPAPEPAAPVRDGADGPAGVAPGAPTPVGAPGAATPVGVPGVAPVEHPPTDAPAVVIPPPDRPDPVAGPAHRADSVIGLAEQVAAAGAAARDTAWRAGRTPEPRFTVRTADPADAAAGAPEPGLPAAEPPVTEAAAAATAAGATPEVAGPAGPALTDPALTDPASDGTVPAEAVPSEQSRPAEVAPEQVASGWSVLTRAAPRQVAPAEPAGPPNGPPAPADSGRPRRISAADILTGRPGLAPGQRQPASDQGADADPT